MYNKLVKNVKEKTRLRVKKEAAWRELRRTKGGEREKKTMRELSAMKSSGKFKANFFTTLGVSATPRRRFSRRLDIL